MLNKDFTNLTNIIAESKVKTALISIDNQEDFFRGALRNENAIAMIPQLVELHKAAFENPNVDIITTQDTHSDNENEYGMTLEGKHVPYHCAKGTDGWEIIEELRPYLAGGINLCKTTFGYDNWRRWLDQYELIVICGVCGDICVISNALIIRAAYPNKRIVMAMDCIASTCDEGQNAAKFIASCNTIETCNAFFEKGE